MSNLIKRNELLNSMSSNAIIKTLPKLANDVSIFLKKHKENKERFKREIQFKVR